MNPQPVSIFVLILTLFLAHCNASTKGSNQLVGNLLVVCDMEFSDHFQQDRQKIIEFWATYMFDVNLRFKTLITVDLQFKISHLVIINDKEDQKFVEETRNSNGSLDWQQTHYKFAEWAYVHQTNITNFDIAILATGAKVDGQGGGSYTYIKEACSTNNEEKKHLSTVALTFDFIWENGCATLQMALGMLLGAPFDDQTSQYTNCKGHGFLMDRVSKCGDKQYFFSKCSDKGIADYVKSSSASCLHTTDDTENDIITASSPKLHPPSFKEQCVFSTNNNSATVDLGENPCLVSNCYVGQNDVQVFAQALHPLDNSLCGDKKFCFRGRCLSYGFQIRNVGNGKCLHSSDRFSSSDRLIMDACVRSPSPLDKFRILEVGPHGKFLSTPYSSPDASENDDKCLSVDLHEENLEYRKCNSEEQEWLGWYLVEAENRRGEFLLFHCFTRSCARATDDFNRVQLSQTCDESDKFMHWKFHDLKPPKNVFAKSFDSRVTTQVPLRNLHQLLQFKTQAISTSTTKIVNQGTVPSFVVLKEEKLGTSSLGIDTTTSLPTPLQYKCEKTSTSTFTPGLVGFVLGVVVCCISIHVLKRLEKYLVRKNSGTPALSFENQIELL